MLWRAGRNIPGFLLKPVAELNAYDVLRSRRLVMVRDAFRALVSRPSETSLRE
jgi:ribosomal protein L4